jgi:hypothetical protein
MHAGLGWNVVDSGSARRRVTHNGMLFSFSARQDLWPEIGGGLAVGVITNTGVGLAPLDADAAADLVGAVILDGAARQPARIGLAVDVVLAVLIVVTFTAAWALVRRRRRQAGEAPPRRRVLTRLLLVVPVIGLGYYPAVLRALTRRDLNWEQSFSVSPLAFVFVAVLAAASTAVLLNDWKRDRSRKTKGRPR